MSRDRDRFSVLGSTRIPLSDGDWIEVKKGLTAGEQRIQDSLAVVPHQLPDGTVVDRIDWSMYEFLRADLWLSDWSFTKQVSGKTISVPKTVAALRALEPEDFDEVNLAVYKHIQEWIASKKVTRAEERLPSDSETKTSQTSPS